MILKVVLTIIVTFLTLHQIPAKAVLTEEEFESVHCLFMKFHQLNKKQQKRFLFLLDRTYKNLLADILNGREIQNIHNRLAETMGDGT